MKTIRTPLQAPLANAFADRRVGTGGCECLYWMLIVNPAHLESVVRECVDHYNGARLHRGLGLSPPVVGRDDAVHQQGMPWGLLHECCFTSIVASHRGLIE